MCSLQIHLGTQLLGILTFQPQDEGSSLDVTMWEELADLVLERALPMAVALLSFSALKASLYLIP